MAAPALTAAQNRHLVAMRAGAERQASAGGHAITWEGTFSDSKDGGTTLHRSQDGWCALGGRNHLRAVVSVVNNNVVWQFGKPTDCCPG
jgi:hypothetical protein